MPKNHQRVVFAAGVIPLAISAFGILPASPHLAALSRSHAEADEGQAVATALTRLLPPGKLYQDRMPGAFGTPEAARIRLPLAQVRAIRVPTVGYSAENRGSYQVGGPSSYIITAGDYECVFEFASVKPTTLPMDENKIEL